jgi:hypothetical protein
VEPARPAAKNGLPGNGVGFSSSVERGLCTSVCAGACGDSAVVGRDPLSALCYTSMGPAHYYFFTLEYYKVWNVLYMYQFASCLWACGIKLSTDFQVCCSSWCRNKFVSSCTYFFFFSFKTRYSILTYGTHSHSLLSTHATFSFMGALGRGRERERG